MAKVSQRTLMSGKSRWQASWSDPTGKRRHKMFGRKKDANAFLDEVKRQLHYGTYIHDEATITVEKAAESYLKSGAVRVLEPATQANYEQHIRLYIFPHLGQTLLTKLTEGMICDVLDIVADQRSPDMAKRVLGTLNRVIKNAQRYNLVGRNVIVDKSIKAPRSEPYMKRLPERHELVALLNSNEGKRHTFLLTAILTGLRLGEMRALSWEDVRFDERLIRVRKASRANGSMKRTKSLSGFRDIPMSGTLVLELKKWRLQCPASSLDLVFPNGFGNVESGSNIRQRIFIPAMKAAGLTTKAPSKVHDVVDQPVFRFHDLRHAAAALFIEQGMGPKRVQELMGHSSIQVTFDIYGYLFRDPDGDCAAADAISMRLIGDV